ncbi:hypothetical protein DL769_009093 [Monosporascus sp. CRB-8-3]|nr:hypothetical protein DL769_009093 [Monosporascus sp. CRB-8-3]
MAIESGAGAGAVEPSDNGRATSREGAWMPLPGGSGDDGGDDAGSASGGASGAAIRRWLAWAWGAARRAAARARGARDVAVRAARQGAAGVRGDAAEEPRVRPARTGDDSSSGRASPKWWIRTGSEQESPTCTTTAAAADRSRTKRRSRSSTGVVELP